ncbi:putative CDP-alcohol phosphatidyltransferase class-I family protein [Cyphellophora attinorum]|uniref:Putative CDP-alcohol phosphatidyltransferase class-I family protein n=1 Tax=Cyphellophora attinorum TaxID=1664694 RepID=A0A0N0NQ40_9EURO|nr:putative CDP-alcohol phosphatidyltransferase class-I family protein [Phialophora attinorum]KPI43259.1 putative CDP-alcohol phosphatidyltransferase class-I family protein [Phialophora attinorum]
MAEDATLQPPEMAPPTERKRHHQRRSTRRLSNTGVTRADLYSGLTVVGPPSSVSRRSSAHDTAAAMEMARHHLASASTGDLPTPDDSQPVTPEDGALKTTDRYAYAFDIDGVLIKGGEVIPEAIEAMRVLNGQNEYGIKVPYIFVTNGGGKTEEERCIQLSSQLELEVSPGQFICGHTPMREMAEKYKTVLVVGGEGEKCRTVAEGYGFQDVITPGDIIKDNSATTPFRQLTEEEKKLSKLRNYGEIDIEAVFVFADSRDWAGDQQIILDLCMSKNGRLGTRSENFDEGPPVFFAHNDVIWATSHTYSRKELKTIAFGKPQLGTFQFATRLLQQWRKDTHSIDAPPETVYFVGDTPESDIRGTNDFHNSGEASNEWHSILVKTGVYQPGTTPAYAPKATVDNVLEAVKYGMKREFERQVKEVAQTTPAIHEE